MPTWPRPPLPACCCSSPPSPSCSCPPSTRHPAKQPGGADRPGGCQPHRAPRMGHATRWRRSSGSPYLLHSLPHPCPACRLVELTALSASSLMVRSTWACHPLHKLRELQLGGLIATVPAFFSTFTPGLTSLSVESTRCVGQQHCFWRGHTHGLGSYLNGCARSLRLPATTALCSHSEGAAARCTRMHKSLASCSQHWMGMPLWQPCVSPAASMLKYPWPHANLALCAGPVS